MSTARRPLSESVRAVLACPVCRHPLRGEASRVCSACGLDFPLDEHGILDLRAPRHEVALPIQVGLATPDPPPERLTPLSANSDPAVDFSAFDVPHHLSRELLSYFPTARPGALALDLGCGEGLHREVLEHAGFECVGIDYGSRGDATGVDLLADAHALPFADRSFDFVMSIAVFEHLRVPPLAAREVCRVLAEGGTFIGTVAFLEPYHNHSYLHHSHLATWSLLADAGLRVERVAPSRHWTVLAAQRKPLFPGLPVPLARSLVAPLDALHRLWWRLMRRRHPALTEHHRLRRTAGAFSFIARRPADATP